MEHQIGLEDDELGVLLIGCDALLRRDGASAWELVNRVYAKAASARKEIAEEEVKK